MEPRRSPSDNTQRSSPSISSLETDSVFISLSVMILLALSGLRGRDVRSVTGQSPDKRLLMRVSGLSGHVTVVTVVTGVTGASLQIHFTFLTDTRIRGFQTQVEKVQFTRILVL